MKYRIVERVEVTRTYEVLADSYSLARDAVMSGEIEPVEVEDAADGCWSFERLYPIGTKGGAKESEWMDVWDVLNLLNDKKKPASTYIQRNDIYDDLVKMNKLLKERTADRFVAFADLDTAEIPPEFDTPEKRAANAE